MAPLKDPVFLSFIFSFFVLPAIVTIFMNFMLKKLKDKKAGILIFIFGSLLFMIVFPVALTSYFQELSIEECIYSIMVSIMVLNVISFFVEKQFYYAWGGMDKTTFESYWNPTKSSHADILSEKNRFPVYLVAMLLFVLFEGFQLSMLILVIFFFFSIQMAQLIMVMFILAILLFLYFGVFRRFIKCNCCGRYLFDTKQRNEYEFYHMAKNILFNKYFVCMHCHARFSMKEGVDLENLPNNYQKDYDQDPPKHWW